MISQIFTRISYNSKCRKNNSLDYECPVGFDESEYYVKLLSRRNPITYATNPNPEDTGPNELIDKICRAFSQSPLSRIPEIKNTRYFEIEPQRWYDERLLERVINKY